MLVQDLSGGVFLSYASEDTDAAAHLCEALRAAGVLVWFDQRELHGGDEWDQAIRARIRDCRLFVPVISRNTEAREEGYFRREWKLAADRMDDRSSRVAFLVPVVLDDIDAPAADVPDRFRQVQWIRLPREGAQTKCVERIETLLGRRNALVDVPAAIAAVETRTPRTARFAVFGTCVAAVLLLAVAGTRFAILHTRAPRSPPKSHALAVLPFADLSEHKDQQYFADGIAEEILNLLMKIPHLRVVGRTSSFAFKDQQNDLPSIARALSVDYVLEGSVRRTADRVRVAVELISAADGTRRWANSFDATTADAIQIEDDIAVRVANALDVEFGRNLPVRENINSPEAYDDYLQGMRGLEENSATSLELARNSFQQALAIEPGFGAAAVGLASADQFLCADGLQIETACPRSRASATRALELDPKNPDAYANSAQVSEAYEMDWSAAAAAINKANELGGGNATDFAAARLAYATGRWDQAREILRELMARDPLDPDVPIDLALFVEFKVGNLAQAESLMRRGLQLAPRYSGGKLELGRILLAQGKVDEASALIKEELPNEGLELGLAIVEAVKGRKDEAARALNELQVPPYQHADKALGFAYMGDIDRAMTLLEQAYEKHDPSLWWIYHDPNFKALETTDRFRALLRKMNLRGE